MAALQNNVWDDLLAEFPVLTDPQDLHFGNRTMRTRCMRQLLDRCNEISRIPFTMEALKKKLKTMHRCRTRRLQRQAQSREDSRGDCWSDQETCSEPTNQIQRVTQDKPEPQTGLFTLVFHCCGVCGENKGDCSKVIDKSYIVKNKITLAMNNLSIELAFNKDIMVCQNCDVKLKDMYEFLKLVSSAHYKFGKKIVNIDLTETEMPIDVDQNVVMNSMTVTDAELEKPTVLQKRKCEETPEVKKKCRVTIDLNISDDSIDDDRNTVADIEAKYQMFKKGGGSLAKSAGEVSKAPTENNEDAILKLKKIIEQDMHKEVNGTGEVADADMERRNDMESEVTSDRKDGNSEDLDVKKEMDADDMLNEVNETGETVTDNDNRNDAATERTCHSEKTNATASKTSDLANIGDPMCVMPQSDLIQLVESIVSRMSNK